MSIEIIKHGTTCNVFRTFICTSCGCEFRTDTDYYKHVMDSSTATKITSICPECGGYSVEKLHNI